MVILKILRPGYNLLRINKPARYLHTTCSSFAGHSKWANIRHVKAEKDGEKATVFTKLSRQIRLAILEGGSDPALNARLKSVIDEALRKNMPMTTIQNNIKKTQDSKTVPYKMQLRYKQKVFLVCMFHTDNIPGLKMQLATILRKNNATIIDKSNLFEDFGLIEAQVKGTMDKISLEDRAVGDAIECGAEEVEVVDVHTATVNFICKPRDLKVVSQAIHNKGYEILNSEHYFKATSEVTLTEDENKGYENFLQKLREINGLESIYDNLENAV